MTLRGFANDVRFAGRMLLRNPWMSLAAVVSLAGAMAVAIGAFSLFWDTYFATLPFAHADRIVAIRDVDSRQGGMAAPRLGVYREWNERQRSLEVLAAAYSRLVPIGDGSGAAVRYPVSTMTASGFQVAGVPPALGRTLLPSDEASGAEPVVVVGHRVWTTLFGSDPGIVGRTIDVGGERRRVVGVMPEGFRFPMSEDLWVPYRIDATAASGVEPRWIQVFGRLAPGVTMPQAQADLDAIRAAYASAHPEDEELRDRRAAVAPYVQSDSGPGEEALFAGTFAFIVLVLAVACASVANLLLCRSLARRGEIAVRAALGASRGRLVAQLVVEALLMTAAAAIAGVAIASAGLRWFNGYVRIENLPFWVHFDVSPAAGMFAVAAALAAAVLAGVGPALRATSAALNDVIRDGQRGASGVRFGAASGVLTIAEVAIGVACLAAAGLAARSLLDAGSREAALPGSHVLVAEVRLAKEFEARADGSIAVPAGEIPAARWPAVAEGLRSAVAGLPGVRTVALATRLPMEQHVAERIEIDGAAGGAPTAGVPVLATRVTPQMFDAFGAKLIAGRLITRGDTLATPRVAVVNRAFAERFFGGGNPLGRRIRRIDPAQPGPWVTIVGIVADLPMNPAGDRQPGYYLAFDQDTVGEFSLAARVDGSPTSLASAVQHAVRQVDPRIDIAGFETHTAMADEMLVSYRMLSAIFTALGGAALFLAAIGIYAVMSFSVTERTREIGIRLALGASSSRVAAAVMRRGLGQMAAGVAIGSAAGWILMRLLAFIPIGMAPVGPLLVGAAAAAMLAAGAAASLVPLARIARVHPADALRHN